MAMIGPRLQLGICGTFDVENYGDLLFPLIAEAELSRRLGPIELHRFSYFKKVFPDWPYDVTSLTELPKIIGALDGMMVGGGHLVRFDKSVAPGYQPPTALIHHPTGYWLTPALLALQHHCPLVWNAPGANSEIPTWAKPLLQLAINGSNYVAVRDEASKQLLTPYARHTEIAAVPDTAFGVARLLDAAHPSDAFLRLRKSLSITRPYIVVQATEGLQEICQLIREHPQFFRNYQFVALEIGPVLGDKNAILLEAIPDIIQLPSWPSPLLIAELVKEAAGVVGVSLHLAITAVAFGVPVFRPARIFGGKYAALASFDQVHPFDRGQGHDAHWIAAKLRPADPSRVLNKIAVQLDGHWDRIASVFASGRRSASSEPMSLFWQSLAGWLENEEIQHFAAVDTLKRELASERQQAVDKSDDLTGINQRLEALNAGISDRDRRIDVLDGLLANSREEIAGRDAQITSLRNSTSWKVTAPVRWIGRRLFRRNNKSSRGIIDLARIESHKLATEPYEWAFVNGLFSRRHAKSLAASFPRDDFKTVKGYDGEKGYEYEARALIHLQADRPYAPDQLSDSWRQIANDLLSPAYRAAMTRLTGCDLRTAPMEAYVCHYGPGAWLGPHLDLKEKIITHVFYFNETWNEANGGCLNILRSPDMSNVVSEILPIVGNSSVLVRSERSWHSVSRVTDGCRMSRRSMNVIFYHPGAVSTMWPAGDTAPLHRYEVE